MDKETYKVACEILNRFGDASTRSQHQSAAIASPNQSLIGSNLATPQKQASAKPGMTPQNQLRQAIMPVPTARTPINVRSIPQSTSLITPSYGQYRIASPTPVVGMHSYILPNNKNQFLKKM